MFSDPSPSLKPSQRELDATSASFVQTLSEPANVAALAVGSLAFHGAKWAGLEGFARLGITRCLPIARALSHVFALASEVSAFRGAWKALAKPAAGSSEASVFDPKAWWGTALDFSIMKWLAPLAPREPLLAASLQSHAMLLGRALGAGLGWASPEAGSYVEKLARAQAFQLASAGAQSIFQSLGGASILRAEKVLQLTAAEGLAFRRIPTAPAPSVRLQRSSSQAHDPSRARERRQARAFLQELQRAASAEEVAAALERMPGLTRNDSRQADWLRQALHPLHLLDPRWARLVAQMDQDPFGAFAKAKALHAQRVRGEALRWVQEHLRIHPGLWGHRIAWDWEAYDHLQVLSRMVEEALLIDRQNRAESLWLGMPPRAKAQALNLMFMHNGEEALFLHCSASEAQKFSNLMGRDGSPFEVGLAVPPAHYFRGDLRVERTLSGYGGAIYAIDPASRSLRIFYGNDEKEFRPSLGADRSERMQRVTEEILRIHSQTRYLGAMQKWSQAKGLNFEAHEVPYAWILQRGSSAIFKMDQKVYPHLSRIQTSFEKAAAQLRELPAELVLVLGSQTSLAQPSVDGEKWPLIEHSHPIPPLRGSYDYALGMPSIENQDGSGDLALFYSQSRALARPYALGAL